MASDGCDEDWDSAPACAGQLQAGMIPDLALPNASSWLFDNLQLLGSNTVNRPDPPNGNGGACPDMVICTILDDPNAFGYREIEIRSGAGFGRTSTLQFAIDASQNAGLSQVERITVMLFSFEENGATRDVLLSLSSQTQGGARSVTMWAEEINPIEGLSPLGSMSWYGVKHFKIEVVSDNDLTTRFLVQHGDSDGAYDELFLAAGNHGFDGSMIRMSLSEAHPTLIRYGNQGAVVDPGMVGSGYAPVVTLSNWRFHIGDVVGSEGRRR